MLTNDELFNNKKVNALRDLGECYSFMKKYLHSQYVSNEEEYLELRRRLTRRKIGIPKDVYAKIEEFVDQNFAPIVYNHMETFAACYTEHIGVMDEDGVFHVPGNKIEAYRSLFNGIINDIEKRLQEFAIKELYPLVAKDESYFTKGENFTKDKMEECN